MLQIFVYIYKSETERERERDRRREEKRKRERENEGARESAAAGMPINSMAFARSGVREPLAPRILLRVEGGTLTTFKANEPPAPGTSSEHTFDRR